MAINVTDSRSNPADQIAHAVNVIGKSKDRKLVFVAVYQGKKNPKTKAEVAQLSGLAPKRVLEEGKKLSKNGIVHQSKVGGETVYAKDDFYAAQRDKILSFVGSPTKFKKMPTKTNPKIDLANTVVIKIPKNLDRSQELSVDDIDSFFEIKKVKRNESIPPTKISENKFKEGIKKILGETNDSNDWGGEINDLLTNRVVFKSQRIRTAFAFKGPGKSGELTPGKMGKNGDQIQRLFRSSASLFVVQYWGKIGDGVVEQVKTFAQLKSIQENRPIYYCVIDGVDSTRVIDAYEKCF